MRGEGCWCDAPGSGGSYLGQAASESEREGQEGGGGGSGTLRAIRCAL